MARGLGRFIAAIGAFGGGYLKGKRDKEEADAREEERRWRREDRARQEAERTAAADTLGRAGTEIIRPEDTAGVLSPAQQEMMRSDIETFGPEAGKFIIESAARDAATPEARAAAAGIKPALYSREQATGDFIRRLYKIDPTRAAQAEATQLQLDEVRDKADQRKKLREVDGALRAWGEKNMPRDAEGKPMITDDAMVSLGKLRVFELGKRGLFDEAMKTAQESMQYATRKIQAEQVERQAAVRDAVAAAGMGDYSKAMEVYNRFVPDGSKATAVVPNRDGSFTVRRVSAVDGTPLSDGSFKNLDQMVTALNGLADSNALANYIERTFKHDIETRRLGLEGARVGLAAKAEERAAAKDKREQARADAVAKGLADYADAEARGDAKAMSAARRAILANGGKLDREAPPKPEVKVGQLGDITVSQPTGGGGVQVTNYGPDMKVKGSVTVPAPGAAPAAIATPKTQAEFDKLPSGALYIDPQDGKKYRKP